MYTTATRHEPAPHRKSTLHVKQKWGKDKFKYTTWHCGGANMFGGYNYSKANTMIDTDEKILDRIKSEVYVVTFQDEETLKRFQDLTNTKLTDIEVKPKCT